MHVGENQEALRSQGFCGLDRFVVVRQEIPAVVDYFDFYPVAVSRRFCDARDPDRFFCIPRSGGIDHQTNPMGDKGENVVLGLLQIDTTQGHHDHFRA